MSSKRVVSETKIEDLRLVQKGKVRDVYAVDENRLLLVATDRISAFDCIFPTLIPRKGEVLTTISVFWFNKLNQILENHLITSELNDFPETLRHNEDLRGRSMIVKKTTVFPVECIVRGYLEGSGWKDYVETGKICGHNLPEGLRQCEKLPQPIFTPATKAPSGHDENINEDEFAQIVGFDTALKLKNYSLMLYGQAFDYALRRGIIIADTKFEFGADDNGNIILIDEVLTPDSSRFWSANDYSAGRPQLSFDKQYVREYVETLEWDKQPPAPALPSAIVEATSERYLTAYKILTGKDL